MENTIYQIADLNTILAQNEKPESVNFRLAHYKNIRSKQIVILNRLSAEKKISIKKYSRSKVNLKISILK